MSVQSEINRINSEVSDQAALISQIKTALVGKVAGGGSSSGGGGSVETCSVTISASYGMGGGVILAGSYIVSTSNGIDTIAFNSEEDFQESESRAPNGSLIITKSRTIDNVVRGSAISIVDDSWIGALTSSGAQLVPVTTDSCLYIFKVTSNATITFEDV